MTPKQQRFVQEYLIDLNATQAAIRAGYAGGGAAEVTGHRLLSNAKVAAAIKAAQAKTAERHEITLERIAEMMQEDRALAIEHGQIGAAATSSMNLAKLHGLITDKVENTNRNLGSGERKRRISELLDRQRGAGVAGTARARSSGNGARKPH